MRNRTIELVVGIFLLMGILALLILAFKVSGLSGAIGRDVYHVTADFNNIGGLKVRSQVSMAGVRIGEVSDIKLDPQTFKAKVTLQLDATANKIPADSSASILTEGLLGANYISLTPGFADETLKDGAQIEETHPAIILEDLIGQLLFSLKNSDKKTDE
ncbi:MAG: outer membrane lipid asymmetry maintenance protein MlaD [Gammaproteobacteria bacterium]